MSENDQMLAFYQLLGRLFYNVAQVDGSIREEEYNAVKDAVKYEWEDLEDTFDSFGSDSAFQIEFVFDYLFDNDLEVDGVLHDLKEFKAKNPSLFTDKLNDRIIHTCSMVADAVAGKNKSELIFLTELEQALK